MTIQYPRFEVKGDFLCRMVKKEGKDGKDAQMLILWGYQRDLI